MSKELLLQEISIEISSRLTGGNRSLSSINQVNVLSLSPVFVTQKSSQNFFLLNALNFSNLFVSF